MLQSVERNVYMTVEWHLISDRRRDLRPELPVKEEGVILTEWEDIARDTKAARPVIFDD